MALGKSGERFVQRYVCHHCDDLECESSTCPICGNRTTVASSAVYLCDECNTPSYYPECGLCHGACRKIGSDIRPVFPEERLLIEVLSDTPFEYCDSSIWNVGGSTYIIDGVRVQFSYKEMMKRDSTEVIEALKVNEKKNQQYATRFWEFPWIQKFIDANRNHLSRIEYEAINYVQKRAEGRDLSKMYVSFSGGKDSTVTSSIVMSALGTEMVPHVYGDTTLEYPESANYLARFRNEHPRTPILVARNDNSDFNALCKKIGPPSRVMRWCCTFFKTGPISEKTNKVFRNEKSILVFQGIRRAESANRSGYDRDSNESKIAKQDVCQVIIDWTNFDVWLYLLSHHIDFNDAYRHGFSRVGCWCCPNNSDWSGFLSSIYMSEQHKAFKKMLYDFARDDIRKPDWKEYVDEGWWRARQGGDGLTYSDETDFSFKPCALEDDTYNFELSRPINETLFSLFIPFGELNTAMGKERLGQVYVLDRRTKQPILRLEGRDGKYQLKVAILAKSGPFRNKSPQTIEAMIKAQVTKFQMCLACSACNSVCKYGAISVESTEKYDVCPENVRYRIDEKKCVGCLSCVLHFDNGCYMKKVTRVKAES